MPRIFDRNDPELLGIYDDAITSWETSGDTSKTAISINLRCDHRISAKREEEFREYFLRLGDLREALDDYVNENVKFTPSPHFCETWCQNLVADCASGEYCEGLERTTELTTVISLSGLATAIKDSYPNLVDEMPEWRELLDIDTQASDSPANATRWRDRFEEWLDRNLFNKTTTEIESFLTKVFKVINHRLAREHHHYNPVWVTTWKNFEKYATLGPDRWNQIVGVPRRKPTWQIVVKYPASKVKCLYRPSQLDSGFYAQHFPSPRETDMAEGGLTMDLGMEDDQPLSEFLHTQIELEIDYWIAAGRLIGKSMITAEELPAMRRKHYEKLIGRYTEDHIKSWMPQPI
jgi:hypothetical protein